MSNTPTNAEAWDLWLESITGGHHPASLAKYARAVLTKWGQPAHSGEPVAWLSPWRADQVTTDYDAYGKHGIPLYTAPQPVVWEPLTCEWTHNDDDGYWDTSCGKAWRFDDGGPKENNMNFCHCCGKTLRTKGGQHGTESST